MGENITFNSLPGVTGVVFCTWRGAAVERVREGLFLNQEQDQNYLHTNTYTCMRNKHVLYDLSKITSRVGLITGSKGSADVTGA